MNNRNDNINLFVNNERFSAENNCVDILGNNDDNEEITQAKLSTELRNFNNMDKLNVDAKADPKYNFECFVKHFMELKYQSLPKN